MSRRGCKAAPAISAMAQILGPLRAPIATQGRSYRGPRKFTDTKELENSALRAIVGKQVGTKNSRHTGKFSRIQQKNQR